MQFLKDLEDHLDYVVITDMNTRQIVYVDLSDMELLMLCRLQKFMLTILNVMFAESGVLQWNSVLGQANSSPALQVVEGLEED